MDVLPVPTTIIVENTDNALNYLKTATLTQMIVALN